MSYINLRGHSVWSTEHSGKGEPVVLLHGGLSSTESWDYLVLPALKRRRVFAYDRTAQGRTKIREGFYHFDFQVDEAIAYLEDVVKKPAHLIGWSDGAIIALLVAIKRPDLVKSLISIGGNYHYDCGLSLEFILDTSEEEYAKFEARSGQPRAILDQIKKKAFEVWASEPNMTTAQLATISCPVLVLAGDDEPFPLAHTVSLFESLQDGRLAVIPGSSHSFVKEKPELLQAMIKDFYRQQNFPITRSPNRRKEMQEKILEAQSSNSMSGNKGTDGWNWIHSLVRRALRRS
jgi:pimeloyl-ACP methyl ester carboxylesterase